MRALWRAVADRFASGPSGQRLLILTYHRVLARPDELLVDDVVGPAFERQMRTLAERFKVLRLDEALARLAQSSLPPRAVSITFDDGYADNCSVALPILQRHGLSGTFFIASGFLDGGCMWNDKIIETLRQAHGPSLDLGPIGLEETDVRTVEARRAAIERVILHLKHRERTEREAATDRLVELVGAPLPDGLMMTSAQVRELRDAGMLVGAHTVMHPVLTAVDDALAEREIAEGRARLRDILREPIDVFAYPNGRPGRDFVRRHVELVRRMGFSAAVSTAWGFAEARSDRWQLPRVAPWDNVPWRLSLRLLRAYREPQTALV